MEKKKTCHTMFNRSFLRKCTIFILPSTRESRRNTNIIIQLRFTILFLTFPCCCICRIQIFLWHSKILRQNKIRPNQHKWLIIRNKIYCLSHSRTCPCSGCIHYLIFYISKTSHIFLKNFSLIIRNDHKPLIRIFPKKMKYHWQILHWYKCFRFIFC